MIVQKDKPPAPRLLLKPPATGNAAGSGAPSPVQTDNPLDGPVDAALLNALTNPRERMVVFQIENNILNFMNSGERTMEIPPGYNSFRRLLAYRIGQRFGLSHTTSDQLSEVCTRCCLRIVELYLTLDLYMLTACTTEW